MGGRGLSPAWLGALGKLSHLLETRSVSFSAELV